MSIELDTSKLETSNEELLQGIITTGLSAMEYHVKLDALKDKEAVNSYLLPVVDGMKQLNKSWDPTLAKEVQDALDAVRTQAVNKDYDLTYRTGLAQAYKFGQIGLDQLRVRENMLEDAKSQMEAIYEDTGSLKTMSPDLLDVIDRVGFNKSELVTQAHNSNVDRVKAEIDLIAEKSHAATMAIGMDADKEREGVQVKMDELSTEVYDKALRGLGFGQMKEPVDGVEGTADYYLSDTGINLDNYEKAEEALKQHAKNLGNLATGNLDVLATTNPHMMKSIYLAAASGERSDKIYEDAASLLGFATPAETKDAENNIRAFVKSIDSFNLHDKLSGWYADAQKEIEERIEAGIIVDPVKLSGNILEARLNELSDNKLHYLNYQVNNAVSGDTTVDREAIKGLDQMANDILANDAAHKHLATLVGEVRDRDTEIGSAIDKAYIGTLAEEDPFMFGIVNAYVTSDHDYIETLRNSPSSITQAQFEEAQLIASNIVSNPDLIEEADRVSDKLAKTADNIAAMTERWQMSTKQVIDPVALEKKQSALKNAAGSWDNKLTDMYTAEVQADYGLTNLKVPSQLSEIGPEVSTRIGNDIARNAHRLMNEGMFSGEGFKAVGGWMSWTGLGQEGQYKYLDRFNDVYDQSYNNKMQALKVMSEMYTMGDGRGGFIPNTTSSSIEEYFKTDKEADLFLDLMAVTRTLANFDPYLFQLLEDN